MEGQTIPTFSFTIVTTNSNQAISFLHDRMPVILTGKEELNAWLNVDKYDWNMVKHLMRPFEGELECYRVPKEVGKAGNNSSDFIKVCCGLTIARIPTQRQHYITLCQTSSKAQSRRPTGKS